MATDAAGRGRTASAVRPRPTSVAGPIGVSPLLLVVFRVAFGLLMMEEGLRYLVLGLGRGLYIAPPFHFTYYGFGWVEPWPGVGMYIHFAVLVALVVESKLLTRTEAVR